MDRAAHPENRDDLQLPRATASKPALLERATSLLLRSTRDWVLFVVSFDSLSQLSSPLQQCLANALAKGLLMNCIVHER
jgi:hypothetical protein